MFSGLRSDSVALSHVWLGLPGDRFQSDGGGLRIAAPLSTALDSHLSIDRKCDCRTRPNHIATAQCPLPSVCLLPGALLRLKNWGRQRKKT